VRIGIVTKHLGLPVGFGTYAARLLDELAKLDEHSFTVYTPRGARVPAGSRAALTAWEHGVVPALARRDRVDVLHYLHTAAPLGRFRAPVVVNVLDTIGWSLPDYALPRAYDALARRAVRKADLVMTISESARSDIAGLFGMREDRIAVTPLAGPPIDDTARPKQPYLLFVGGTERRKNLRTVLEAFALGVSAEVRLKVVGPKTASPVNDDPDDLVGPLSTGQRERVDWLGHVSSEELERLYREATALVFPSLYEGFGLPVLEAMARHTPVICSNVSSLPEVAGDGALLVDPADARALRDAIQRLLDDQALRDRLVARGLDVAGSYSWQRTARLTVAAYERVGG
jgi:glycosyltransferase involved in cell wall biosynthesis